MTRTETATTTTEPIEIDAPESWVTVRSLTIFAPSGRLWVAFAVASPGDLRFVVAVDGEAEPATDLHAAESLWYSGGSVGCTNWFALGHPSDVPGKVARTIELRAKGAGTIRLATLYVTDGEPDAPPGMMMPERHRPVFSPTYRMKMEPGDWQFRPGGLAELPVTFTVESTEYPGAQSNTVSRLSKTTYPAPKERTLTEVFGESGGAGLRDYYERLTSALTSAPMGAVVGVDLSDGRPARAVTTVWKDGEAIDYNSLTDDEKRALRAHPAYDSLSGLPEPARVTAAIARGEIIDDPTAEPCQHADEAERLRAQLAACGVAAHNGSKKFAHRQGDYGWSPAYADVLALRRGVEEIRNALGVTHEDYGAHGYDAHAATMAALRRRIG